MLEYGQPFNPYNTAYGIFIPAGVVESTVLGSGAKVCFGVLLRNAGRDGRCYPKVTTIAARMGVSERQARRYLADLEHYRLIKRRLREYTSSVYVFLYHRVWDVAARPGGDTDDRGGRTKVSGEGGQKRPRKEASVKKDQLKVFKTAAGRNVQQSGLAPAGKTLSDTKRIDDMLEILRHIREQFPRSDLARNGAPDRAMAKRIVQALRDYTPQEFFKLCVKKKFTDEGRTPYDGTGPRKWSLFELWAKDFAGER